MTITKLARQFGLSRSTLIYYDSIGILSPDRRSEKGYRIYSQANLERLREICALRETGLALEQIQAFLHASGSDCVRILKQRLSQLSAEMHELRRQQQALFNLVGDKELQKQTTKMTKNKWVKILRAAGLDDAGMLQWHRNFEKDAPEAHQEFLENLGLDDQEIGRIRNL